MANWFARRFKKAADVAEELFWGALIVSALGLGWVYYERLRGAPMFIAIGFFSAVILTVAIALILKSIKSRLTDETNKLPTDRIEELEREKAALEKARGNDIKAHEEVSRKIGQMQDNESSLQISLSSKIEKLESSKWLYEIAERDKSHINEYVYIVFDKVKYEGLGEVEPFIEVIFNIINASVYTIIIDKDIKDGAVYLNNIELNPKMAKLGGSLHSISHDENEKRYLVIKQWLSPELAKRISSPLPDDALYFDKLWLTVTGANADQEVVSQRLHLPPSISVERPESFKAEAASLKAELEALSKNELTLEISTLFDSSVTLMHPKDTHPFPTDEYIIKAYLKIRFKNPSEHNTTIESMTLSLCKRSDSGEVKEITPNRLILNVYPDSPSGAKSSGPDRVDFDDGFPVAGGSITPYYWFWYDLEILRQKVGNVGSNHILRLALKDLRQKRPTIVDIQVDWESARKHEAYILWACPELCVSDRH